MSNNNGKHKPEDTEQTEQKPQFGEPYENTRKHSKFDFGEGLVVVPVEIEIDSMLYNLIQMDILSYFDAGHVISRVGKHLLQRKNRANSYRPKGVWQIGVKPNPKKSLHARG